MKNNEIFRTKNFILEIRNKPHVTRLDGGHCRILPIKRVKDRQDLSPSLATEMAWFTMLSGEAMTNGLRKQGIDIGLINYQDMKNWGVFKPEGYYLHVHLYGRAKSAKIQKYGDALDLPHRETGFYDDFESLNEKDIEIIRYEINKLIKTEKYDKLLWKFS